MPRVRRIIPSEGALHIIGRGNNKRLLFKKERDYNHFKKLLQEYKLRYNCLIYHYCFMRNHVHLIAGVNENSFLSKMMHGLELKYAQYYKKRYAHIGHFWQDRFKSFLIKDDIYLLACGLYIEANPVRASLTRHPTDYRWSSYNFYAFGYEDKIIDIDPYYLTLSEKPDERQNIYRGLMEERLLEYKRLQLIEQ